MANEMSDIKATAQIAMRNGALAPQNFEGLWRMAQIMAASGFMPKGMERVESVFVAVQFGLEVGLSPMQAVQNIAPINGRPAIWGDAMLGLVRASGLLDSIKEDLIGSGDAMEAVCQIWRKGEDNPVSHRFSVSDAKRAGLWQTSARVERRRRDGGGTYQADNDSPWWKYPRRMLQMRARGFCLRDAFPDVLKGLYSREELEGVPERYMGSAVIEEDSSVNEELLAEAAKRRTKEATDPPEASEQEWDQKNERKPVTTQGGAEQDGVKPDGPRPEPNALGILVDPRDIPWILEVHSANRTWNADGTWRQKRGVDPDLLRRLEGQAKADMARRLSELDEKKETAPWQTDSEPAETEPRDPPPTESGGAGFSYKALLEEARFADTDEARDQVRDLVRSSNLTDAERSDIESILRG